MFMRWVMHHKILRKKIVGLLIALLILARPLRVAAQENLDFEQGLKGWLTKGNAANFTIDKTEHHHGDESARIGKGHGMIYKLIDVVPLSIIQFKAYVKSSEKSVNGCSFLSFYNAQH